MVLRRFITDDAGAEDLPGPSTILSDAWKFTWVRPWARNEPLGHLQQGLRASLSEAQRLDDEGNVGRVRADEGLRGRPAPPELRQYFLDLLPRRAVQHHA